MGESPSLTLLELSPLGDGTWYRHSEGYTVREWVPGGHVWRRASPMSSQCIFCSVTYQRAVEPRTSKCSARVQEQP